MEFNRENVYSFLREKAYQAEKAFTVETNQAVADKLYLVALTLSHLCEDFETEEDFENACKKAGFNVIEGCPYIEGRCGSYDCCMNCERR